jgi:hypothetical protein
MIENGIESESKAELRKFESKECFKANVLFLLRFCVFVGVFDSFGTSKIEYFASNFNFLEFLKEFNNIWTFNSVFKKEMKIAKIERDCFVMRSNFMNYEIFCFSIFDLTNCDFSNVEIPLFL